jgi:hypothetical protein
LDSADAAFHETRAHDGLQQLVYMAATARDPLLGSYATRRSSMTIVAVNGGGNTPQGVQLERCFVKSWSTSGDADGTNDSFIFADYRPTESLAVDPTNPNVDLRPMETPGPDDDVGLPAVQMDDGLLVPPSNIGGVSVGCGDVDFADYKPTESLAVDPTNPNVDLRPMETPGPDDNVGLPAVQIETGPAVAMEALTIAHEGFWLI